MIRRASSLLAALAAAQGLFSSDPPAAFAPEQAARGQAVYARSCASCHGTALQGNQFGSPLKGELFESHWRGRPWAEFSTHIRSRMPPGRQGAISSQGYADIEAYLYLANTGAFPAAGIPVAAPPPPPRPEPPPQQQGERRGPPPLPAASRGENDPVFHKMMQARADKLAAMTPVTDELIANPPASDWLAWRRTPQALGYSPLRQIRRSNVKQLRTAWSWSLPLSGNEITPLVHDGVMFIYSGPAIQALDAASGDLLWEYQRALPRELDGGRNMSAKTMALHGDRLFAPTADGHLIALDMRTGRLLWDQPVVPAPGEGIVVQPTLQLSGGPIVVHDKVIVGVSLGIAVGGGCFIVGLDADSGRESWRFHTIARPDAPGGDSWNGAPVKERFGAGVWTVGSYDPELDLVYFGIGNTYNTATLLQPRPGTPGVSRNDALDTNATVALRPRTGELAWHFQHLKRDVWDMDWEFEQSIVTLPVNGKPRKLLVTGGKLAIFDAVDAATGAFVFSQDLGVQNLVTGVDPVTGEKLLNPALEPEAGKPKLICPSNFGARNWPATALNPDNGMLFVPMAISCADYLHVSRDPAQTAAGGIDIFFPPRIPPGGDGDAGRLTAVDLRHRRIAWTHRQRMPLASAALATAGGLLFAGDLDRYFNAFDQASGKVLWRTRLNAAPESFPITYLANGRQYVAVVTGGGAAFGANGRGTVPELAATQSAVTLVVFELPRSD
jgi:alcohol dehydrogenase (cytochrome c)